jgi:SAM-dependent methyltransferase
LLNHYHRRSTCRLCGSADVSKVLALAQTPLANAFVTSEALHKKQSLYPLDLFLCASCGHAQLLDVIDPVVLYEHYVYVSGTSPVFVRHFKEYANYVTGNFHPSAGALVVDIGANDGTLLRFFREFGLRVLGVDPAKEIAERTIASGIPIVNDFFTPALADNIRAEHGAASVITANNVIAHIDDLASVMEGVRRLLAPDGIFSFEVSYLADMVEKTLFDMIYHEHLDYHSVRPLKRFFEQAGFEMIEATRVDTHGGSLRGVLQHKGGPRRAGASVADLLVLEESLGLNKTETFKAFARHIENVKTELVGLLRLFKAEGKRIAGFGAPAKTTTLMYHFGLDPGMIDFIVDDSPLKQGHYTPGMHIPVLPAMALQERQPDYAVILAWNFAEPIMAKHTAFSEAGGKFIIPLPRVQVV